MFNCRVLKSSKVCLMFAIQVRIYLAIFRVNYPAQLPDWRRLGGSAFIVHIVKYVLKIDIYTVLMGAC